ncbi:MAG: ribosomal-processing cysteine protease Prp [Lachnospiraceae bacterium]|nr:ribosomal-processing cysteine protease Prp [Lachnospiraceae bacterium]
MICVTIYKNSEQEYTAFQCMGHAEYAEAGYDIVCAAVSALVLNTINSIEKLVSDPFEIETEQESGFIDFSLKEGYSKDSLLLIRSLVLGLQGIQKNYGNNRITLKFKEV